MIIMLFEYTLHPDYLAEYGEHAGILRDLVNEVDGFLSVERYRSESDPDKLLALGVFRDEQAVSEWRNHPAHRQVQRLGRLRLITDYRLRMATLKRDYGMDIRHTAPHDSQVFHALHTLNIEEA
ncbi:MAG: antibiotic biosynthesis monooxygenase [Chloroflexota bacterium]